MDSNQLGHFVGIDLAWKSANRTGLAAVDDAGRLIASASVRSDDEIAAWIAANAPQVVVAAVDAPLIVPNETGQRVGENLVAKAFGAYGASPHSSSRSRSMFNPPRALELADRFGWTTDPAEHGRVSAPACIEVYPHPAMVGLFRLGTVLPYKSGSGRTPESRREQFAVLMDHLEAIAPLALGSGMRWPELREAVAGSTRHVDLDLIEDELDAILCAHLAWLWHEQPDALHLYGSHELGYIVAPPAPSHASQRPVPRVAGAVVPEPAVTDAVTPVSKTLASFSRHVIGLPKGAGGARQWAWQDAVRAAFAGCALPEQSPVAIDLGFTLDSTHQRDGNEADLDNLVKATIDALDGPLGARKGTGLRKEADDVRVTRITATKRHGSTPGAVIVVSELPPE
ncbi:DUF429 domain-containing protein [Nocardioides sp. Root140]|uniref:DUF429 domain-containing protein n=1 Tax=Nocardioides sp. Root140 TaxID=1736460 RepID=UPI0006F6D693|nr:DUF429 domain-containing protein [Nocardioides sp. Root140]KQY51570.1 hypothetical protein ASD30_19565 [Nocardioides sp. Root140]